jgi:hypothetical protein
VKTAACFLAIVMCSVGFWACGSSGDGSTVSKNGTAGSDSATEMQPAPSSAELREIARPPKAPPQEKPPVQPTPQQEKKKAQKEKEAYELKRYGTPSEQSAPFAQYSDKGPVKLHLAEFGDEASAMSRSEVGPVLDAYLHATAAEEWDKACAYLDSITKAQFEEIAKQQKDKPGCGEILRLMINQPNPQAVPQGTFPAGGVASLRIEEGGPAGEGAGFALLHGDDGADYWITVRREGGAWKVGAIALQSFAPR